MKKLFFKFIYEIDLGILFCSVLFVILAFAGVVDKPFEALKTIIVFTIVAIISLIIALAIESPNKLYAIRLVCACIFFKIFNEGSTLYYKFSNKIEFHKCNKLKEIYMFGLNAYQK